MGRFAAYRPLRPLNAPIANPTDDTTNLVKALKFPCKSSISGLGLYRPMQPRTHERLRTSSQ